MIRRLPLLALLLAAPAAALDCAAAAPLLFPGDAAAAAEAARPGHGRCTVARWADGAEAPWVAAAVRDHDRLAVALLRDAPDGSARIVAGPVEIEAMTVEPFHSGIVEVVPARRFGAGTVAVTVANAYLSRGRSTLTTALHLFRWHGDALTPVLAAYVSAQHAGAAPCPRRPGQRERTCRTEWSLDRRIEPIRPAAPHPGTPPPDLVIRDARTGRTLSRHRWAGDTYAPPFFDGLPSFGED